MSLSTLFAATLISAASAGVLNGRADCRTSTITGSQMCDPPNGQIGVPTQILYPLPVTHCPGKPPHSVPLGDYSECYMTLMAAPTPAPEKRAAECSTNTITGSILCNEANPTPVFYPLEVTSCEGQAPSSTPDQDFQDCVTINALPAEKRQFTCSTSTITSSILCNRATPTPVAYPMEITFCGKLAPSSTPGRDFEDCFTTQVVPREAITFTRPTQAPPTIKERQITRPTEAPPTIKERQLTRPTQAPPTIKRRQDNCATAIVDALKDCGTTSIRYGYEITKCADAPPRSTVTEPACPGCFTAKVEAIKGCGTTNIRYGYDVTSCPGSPASSTPVVPACPTPKAKRDECDIIFVNAQKDCGTTKIPYGGEVTACPGKPLKSAWTEPACPTPTA